MKQLQNNSVQKFKEKKRPFRKAHLNKTPHINRDIRPLPPTRPVHTPTRSWGTKWAECPFAPQRPQGLNGDRAAVHSGRRSTGHGRSIRSS